MLYYIIKIGISAVVIAAVSEIAKRSSIFGALIASLPLTSLLAILWMRFDKVETGKIAELSQSIFWLVLPSLAFFILFPALIHRGAQFWISFSVSAGATVILYFVLIWVLKLFDVSI